MAAPRKIKESIFSRILDQAEDRGHTDEFILDAAGWFRNKAKQLGKYTTPEDLMAETWKMRNRIETGRMYHFFYDAKHKLKLPYFDRFPLIFMIGPAEKGFLGINLHYLPPRLRAELMDALHTLITDDTMSARTKLFISYNILKGASQFEAFKPCLKHYLWEHVESKFLRIEADEWNIALFLPTERFVTFTAGGVSTRKVWADSRKKI